MAIDERLAAQVRSDVRQWLSEHWSPGQDRRAFTEAAVDAGWARPSWPRDMFGRDLPEELTPVIAEEFTAAGAPVPDTTASAIAATAIKDFAESAELRGPVLRKLLTGEYRTCLLYSEPGAGSDLAAVQTRADRDGEEWVVNGQKVWTSGARQATHGLLAARTNWDVPKRRGITYFLLPMRQDGVEIRPIKQMTGQSTFNEVFFTNARVPDIPADQRPGRWLAGPADRPGRRADEHGRRPAPGPGGPRGPRGRRGGGLTGARRRGAGHRSPTRPAATPTRSCARTSPASTRCAVSGPGTPNDPAEKPT